MGNEWDPLRIPDRPTKGSPRAVPPDGPDPVIESFEDPRDVKTDRWRWRAYTLRSDTNEVRHELEGDKKTILNRTVHTEAQVIEWSADASNPVAPTASPPDRDFSHVKLHLLHALAVIGVGSTVLSAGTGYVEKALPFLKGHTWAVAIAAAALAVLAGYAAWKARK